MARSLSKVCFFGLGMMGRPMAALVAQAGYPLVVSDTDQKLLKEVCQQTGAEALDASRHLGDIDVVITRLPNAQAVSNTLVGTYGLAKLLKPGTCVVDMSASEPSKSQALSRDLAEVGVDWLHAPVFGNVQEALVGTLTILVGGRFETLLHARLQNSAIDLDRSLRVRIQLRSFEAICRMIGAGMGVGILPHHAIQHNLPQMNLSTIAFDEPWAQRELRLCVRSKDALSVIARQMVDHLLKP